MAAINSCNFMGRFTSDPEIQRSKSGSTYVRFTLAINDRVYDNASGEYVDKALFLPFVAFNDVARKIADKGIKGMKATVSCVADQTMFRSAGQTNPKKEIVFRVIEVDLDESYAERKWHSNKWF